VSTTLQGGWVGDDGRAVFVGTDGIVQFDGARWFVPVTPSSGRGWSGVWGSASDDVYVVGYRGRILHFDGTAWSPVQVPTKADLYGVWGRSADDVFVVGASGTVLHYDGTRWSRRQTGRDRGLTEIWGSSGSDVYAAESGGALLHYDGRRWSPVQFGASGVHGISGTAPDDVYVVTSEGLHHHDGKRWTLVRRGPDNREFFIAVHAPRPGEVYVAQARDDLDEELSRADSGDVLRLEGRRWKRIDGFEGPYLGFAGAPGEDAYVYGYDGVIHRLRGDHVERVTPPRDPWILRVTTRPDGTIVGMSYTGNVLQRGDGSWQRLSESPLDRGRDIAVDDETVWVAGYAGQSRESTPMIARHDGAGWKAEWVGVERTDATVMALGGSGTNRFAVGTHGLILRYDGSRWSPMQSPTDAKLRAVWVAPDGVVYAGGSAVIGREGIVLMHDGSSWSEVSLADPLPVDAIWGTSSSNVFVATSGWRDDDADPWERTTEILRYDGSSWSEVFVDDDSGGESFRSIWGNSDRDAFALRTMNYADGGYTYSSWNLFHYDGDAWMVVAKGEGEAYEDGFSTPDRTFLFGSPRAVELYCQRHGDEP
jgi:hypothetical protein